MFPRAFRIARIGGVDVRVDPSWVLIALLFAWTFQAEFARGWPSGIALGMGIVATVLMFLSILAHELGHALEGIHRGIEVQSITLFMFGGVTEMHLDPKRPRDEFVVAAVGPYISLVVAAVMGIVATVVDAFEGPATVSQVAGTLGWLNLALAIFNLIPGAPLDGGRVLRALLWAVTKDRRRAVRLSSYAGQGVGLLLILWAAWLVIQQPEALFGAIWRAFIGVFIFQAARAERQQSEIEEILEGRTVASLTTGTPPALPADRPLAAIADRIAASPGIECYPVTEADETGPVVGAVRFDDVMDVDPQDRTFRTVRDVMRPLDDVPSVDADADLSALLRAVQDSDLVQVRSADGSVLALLTERQVTSSLERLYALARRRKRRGSSSHLPPRDGGADDADRSGHAGVP